MKTIKQALVDEIHYPLNEGFIENRLLARGLEKDANISAEIFNSNEFRGAVADCLYSLIDSPNFSESDISITLTDRNLILKKANSIYSSIGEDEKNLNQPKVYVGWN